MLERYDHRVTLETIITSQRPEKKQLPKSGEFEPSKNIGGSIGGQSVDGGGQKEGGRNKISPPTPRQQRGGVNGIDHTPTHQKQQNLALADSAAQNQSGRTSPRTTGQKSNNGRVSPRLTNHRGQRAKDNTARNGSELCTAPEGGVSVIGSGRPGDTKKKKNTSQNQQVRDTQTAATATAAATAAASSNSNRQQTEQSRKGKRGTQQTSSRIAPPTTAPTRKRSISPARGGQSDKQTSSRDNQSNRHRDNDLARKHVSNGADNTAKKKEKNVDNGDDDDDEFVWDSSEETEILDTGGVRNGPVYMTDVPPKGAPLRPIPQVVKPVVNGGSVKHASTTRHGQEQPHRQLPMFEVWKDSDDEDIDDDYNGHGDREGKSVAAAQPKKGRDELKSLQRTHELASLEVSDVSVIPVPSHLWERTQSARNLQDIDAHFTSLIRRVQSAHPVHHLSTLTEASSCQTVLDTSDDCFNVFTMSSVWGSGSGLLSSKMRLFNSDISLHEGHIDSEVMSSLSIQNIESSEGQQKKKRDQSSFYSMLDALTEEMTTSDKTRGEVIGIETSSVAKKKGEGVPHLGLTLLDGAVQSTQSSVTVQEAIEDEVKCPLRSNTVAELMMENSSLRSNGKYHAQDETEKANDSLDTKVDVETLMSKSLSDPGRGTCTAMPPAIELDDESAGFLDGSKPFKGATIAFLASFSFDQNSTLEALTDKVLEEEQFSSRHSPSTLQRALQEVAHLSSKQSRGVEQLSVFAPVRQVGGVGQSSDATSFEDPAIVSRRVCLEEDVKQDTPVQQLAEGRNQSGTASSVVSLQEIEGKFPFEVEKETFSMASPVQAESLVVFPSAFDDGIGVNFQLSANNPLTKSTSDKSQSTSREQTQSDHNSSPFHSQTPVNDPSEVSAEQNGLFPSTDTEELGDEFISAQESTLTLSMLEPNLDLALAIEDSDDLCSTSPESDLIFLTGCFPDLEQKFLNTLLTMCKGNVEEALSVALVSQPTFVEVDRNPSFDSTDTIDDASSTVSSASYTEQYLHHYLSGQQPDSSPEQLKVTLSKAGPSEIKFTVGGGDLEEDEAVFSRERELVPFFGDSDCINDEEIARALQEQLNLEASDDNQPTAAEETSTLATSTSDVMEVADQRDRSSSHGSDSTRPSTKDENLELRLSTSLARQLQDMFGSVSDHLPFEGNLSISSD